MGVAIDWSTLGEVFVVSFGAAVGVIVLFSFGVSTLAPLAGPRSTAARPTAMLYFLACALVVAYSLYLIITK